MPAIKLTYFDLRARAEVARLILAQVYTNRFGGAAFSCGAGTAQKYLMIRHRL
jgi:hypothetical protein